MKVHSAWLAAGLVLCVVLGCKFGNTNTSNTNTNSNTNSTASNSTSDASSGPGEFISELHMAKDDGGDPGDQSSTFGPSDRTIHAVAKLKESKSGTKMKFSWWIVDAEGAKNEKIKDIDYTTKALENVVHGHLTLPRDWPKGKYKVEVYVNGSLDRTAEYNVE
jgi:hypothetical protein